MSHPSVSGGGWRVKEPTGRATIVVTAAGPLRMFEFHPHMESPRARIAPIFLNGTLARYRTAIRDAMDFDALFSIADQSIHASYVERLRFLRAEDAHLTKYQDPLSLASTKIAILLLLNYETLIRPELVVTAAGNMQVEWYESDYRRLVVECMPDGSVRFVALYDLEQLAGVCNAGILVSQLAASPIWHWFHGGW